jgi:hypothetical protein
MKALLACACAAVVLLVADPDRMWLSIAIAWLGLAVALAPVIGAALRRRRLESRVTDAAAHPHAGVVRAWSSGSEEGPASVLVGARDARDL